MHLVGKWITIPVVFGYAFGLFGIWLKKSKNNFVYLVRILVCYVSGHAFGWHMDNYYGGIWMCIWNSWYLVLKKNTILCIWLDIWFVMYLVKITQM